MSLQLKSRRNTNEQPGPTPRIDEKVDPYPGFPPADYRTLLEGRFGPEEAADRLKGEKEWAEKLKLQHRERKSGNKKPKSLLHSLAARAFRAPSR